MEQLEKLEKEIHEIKATLNRVHTAIVGSDLSKDGGIIQRVFDLEKTVSEIEQKFIKQVPYNIYVKILWLCAGSIGMAIFSYILLLIFKR